MNARARIVTRSAWITVAAVAVLVLSVAACALTLALPTDDFAVVGLSFSVVGALLLVRRPDNPIGWVQSAIGLLVCSGSACTALALELASSGRATSSTTVLLAWYGEWYWVPFLFLTLAGLPALLPTGELRSPQARRLWRMILATIAVVTPLAMFQRALLAGERPPGLPNPVGWLPYDDVDTTLLVPVMTLGAVVLGSVAVVAVIRRLRRAEGVERQQLKAVTSGAVASVVGFALNVVSQAVLGRGFPLWLVGLTVGVTPLAILVAVLRYRLFEIDQLVSRTVTYALVSTVLVGIYALLTVVPAVLFDLRSDLLVAAATLAAAAVVVPVRNRVQSSVDRRFNRARYDAVRVVERFGSQLRSDVDLAGLVRDVHLVVGATVQPAHVSLWLPGDRTPR